MRVQVYADGVTVYDSRLDDYKLLALTSTTGLNVGGTATITMPPNHPAYNAFTGYRTPVEIYKNGKLVWRGRALYPTDDFYKKRTVTCEGERCFLRDAVMRPYIFQDSPAAIFEQLVNTYNAQVEAFKQFKLGTCDVVDPNNYVRLESTNAEQVSDTIDKLVERCGGYILFTTDGAGDRVINWKSQLNYANNQVIEFGENLLDYSRSDANTDLVTVLVPYGAQLENGSRLTIESVNDGLDFIQDYAAVALRGVVSRAMYWDDITEPHNLLNKAQQYLNEKKNAITALTLSAFDLSAMDQDFDTFLVGDLIRVRSAPHNLDDDFLLKERTEDYLNPSMGRVNLGKELNSLAGADAAGDKSTINALNRVEKNIRAEFTLNTAAAIEEAKQTLTSLIEQTAEAIKLEVSDIYATGDEVQSLVSTSMTQLKDSFEFLFTELQTAVDTNDASAREQFDLIEKYIRFVDGNIIVGEVGNEVELHIENDIIKFLNNGAEVAYFSNKQMVVTDGEFLHSLIIGNIGILPRENGNTSIVLIKSDEGGEG